MTPELYSPGTGQQIGKYRLIELVGRGAMGRVYAAHDEHTDRKVAVKVLMADLEGEPDIRARFQREAQAAARLGHRNVITVYDVGEDHGRPFIVMELLRGWTLEGYLNQPISRDLERKVDVMIQVCDAMAAAHAAGIIHRDLKPGNLFVQFDGLLKVLDFGVARLASSSMTTAGAQPGTLHFMSPEQARGEDIDNRSDIFSAGGVFYRMLTGRRPFPGEEWTRVIRMLQFDDPVALSSQEAPPDLAAIVTRCLQKEAEARYPTFQSLALDLTRFQRKYQVETRGLIESTALTYRAVLAKLTSVRETAARGGDTAVPASPVIDQLNDTYPLLRERGADVFRLISFSRNRIIAHQEELAGELARLDQFERTLAQRADLIAAAQQDLADGRFHRAMRTFEQILTAAPQCGVAREGLVRCRAALAKHEADAQRIKALVRDAQTAARAESWEEVISLCNQVLAIDRTVPLAVALLDAARSAVEELRRRAAEIRLQQAVTEQLRSARARFQRGYGDAALADLRAFIAAEPTAAEVQIEIDRLTAVLSRRADEAAKRADDVRRHSDAARALLNGQELERAVLEARLAVESDPVDHACVVLLCEVIERDRLDRIEKERQRIAEQLRSVANIALDSARDAFTEGDVPRAVAAAENAVRLFPSLAEATDFLKQAREALESGESAEAFEAPDIVPVPVISNTREADSVDVTTSGPPFGPIGRRPERPDQAEQERTLRTVRVVRDADAKRQ